MKADSRIYLFHFIALRFRNQCNQGIRLITVQDNGWYEMFYRGYDPALGRMLQVDPYAASFASQTPYNYALNSPGMINDPSGGYAQLTNSIGREMVDRAYENGWALDFQSAFESNSFGTGASGRMYEAELAGSEQRRREQGEVSTVKDANGQVIGITFSGGAAVSLFSAMKLGGGIDITFSPGAGEKGKDLVEINLVAIIMDCSSAGLTQNQLQKLAKSIENRIESSFSGKAKGLQWKTNATIGLTAAETNNHPDPFVFQLVDDVRGIVPNRPVGTKASTSTNGANITYMNATGHDLVRTAAHEFGHALGLYDIHNETFIDRNDPLKNGNYPMYRYTTDDWKGNLMHQSATINSDGEPMAGSAIESWQIWNILIRNGY